MPENENEFILEEDEQYEDQSDKKDDGPKESEPPAPVEPEDQGEPPEPVNPYEAEFKELGLDRQFPGGIGDMMRRMPYMNKWQTQLSQRNTELERQIDEARRQSPQGESSRAVEVDESFWSDPFTRLDGRYAPVDAVQKYEQRLAAMEKSMFERELNYFKDRHPDFQGLMDSGVIHMVVNDDPGVLGLKDPLGEVYRRAKEIVKPREQQAVEQTEKIVNKNIEQGSRRADTTGTGRKPPPKAAGKISQDQLWTMPLEKLRKHFGGFGPDEDEE